MSAETRSLKQQIRFLRKFLAAGNFSSSLGDAVLEAIKHGRQYLFLLCKRIQRQARQDLSQYIAKTASKLDRALFCNQPDEVWKIIKPGQF